MYVGLCVGNPCKYKKSVCHVAAPARLLIVLANLGFAASQANKLYDSFQQFAARTSGWREDDNFDAKGEGEAGTVDGDAAHARFKEVSLRRGIVVV